jgi:TonB family protein
MMPSRITSNALSIALLLVSSLSTAAAQTNPASAGGSKTASEPVFHVGGNVSAPRLLYDPAPEFSEAARKAHHQGVCELRLIVGSDGNPRDIKITHPLGMGLDEKSIEAVRTWRFEPARRDGRPVAVEISVTVSFSLGNDDARLQELLERVQREAPPRPAVSTSVEPCAPSSSGYEQQRSSGVSITVAEMLFDGAFQVPTADQGEIATSIKQRTYEGTLDEVTSEAVERVKAAWQNRGYFKADVSGDAKTLTSSPASARIVLTIHVNEGKQYQLGKITFKNNTVISDASVLRSLFPIQDGDLFDRDKIGHGLDALRKAYAEMGYINFTLVPDTKFDDENKLIDLEIKLDEGKQFYIRGISILSSDERMSRNASRDMPFQPGDIYNQRLLELFLLKYASVLNADRDRNEFLRLDEQAGTVAITFDLRNCPMLARSH